MGLSEAAVRKPHADNRGIINNGFNHEPKILKEKENMGNASQSVCTLLDQGRRA